MCVCVCVVMRLCMFKKRTIAWLRVLLGKIIFSTSIKHFVVMLVQERCKFFNLDLDFVLYELDFLHLYNTDYKI